MKMVCLSIICVWNEILTSIILDFSDFATTRLEFKEPTVSVLLQIDFSDLPAMEEVDMSTVEVTAISSEEEENVLAIQSHQWCPSSVFQIECVAVCSVLKITVPIPVDYNDSKLSVNVHCRGWLLSLAPPAAHFMQLMNLATICEQQERWLEAMDLLFLTGVSMMNARRFTQSFELFMKVKTILLAQNPEGVEDAGRMCLPYSVGFDGVFSYALARLDIISAEAMNQHGQIAAKLATYRNAALAFKGSFPKNDKNTMDKTSASNQQNVEDDEIPLLRSMEADAFTSLYVLHPHLLQLLNNTLHCPIEALQIAALRGIEFYLDKLGCSVGLLYVDVVISVFTCYAATLEGQDPSKPIASPIIVNGCVRVIEVCYSFIPLFTARILVQVLADAVMPFLLPAQTPPYPSPITLEALRFLQLIAHRLSGDLKLEPLECFLQIMELIVGNDSLLATAAYKTWETLVVILPRTELLPDVLQLILSWLSARWNDSTHLGSEIKVLDSAVMKLLQSVEQQERIWSISPQLELISSVMNAWIDALWERIVQASLAYYQGSSPPPMEVLCRTLSMLETVMSGSSIAAEDLAKKCRRIWPAVLQKLVHSSPSQQDCQILLVVLEGLRLANSHRGNDYLPTLALASEQYPHRSALVELFTTLLSWVPHAAHDETFTLLRMLLEIVPIPVFASILSDSFIPCLLHRFTPRSSSRAACIQSFAQIISLHCQHARCSSVLDTCLDALLFPISITTAPDYDPVECALMAQSLLEAQPRLSEPVILRVVTWAHQFIVHALHYPSAARLACMHVVETLSKHCDFTVALSVPIQRLWECWCQSLAAHFDPSLQLHVILLLYKLLGEHQLDYFLTEDPEAAYSLLSAVDVLSQDGNWQNIQEVALRMYCEVAPMVHVCVHELIEARIVALLSDPAWDLRLVGRKLQRCWAQRMQMGEEEKENGETETSMKLEGEADEEDSPTKMKMNVIPAVDHSADWEPWIEQRLQVSQAQDLILPHSLWDVPDAVLAVITPIEDFVLLEGNTRTHPNDPGAVDDEAADAFIMNDSDDSEGELQEIPLQEAQGYGREERGSAIISSANRQNQNRLVTRPRHAHVLMQVDIDRIGPLTQTPLSPTPHSTPSLGSPSSTDASYDDDNETETTTTTTTTSSSSASSSAMSASRSISTATTTSGREHPLPGGVVAPGTLALTPHNGPAVAMVTRRRLRARSAPPINAQNAPLNPVRQSHRSRPDHPQNDRMITNSNSPANDAPFHSQMQHYHSAVTFTAENENEEKRRGSVMSHSAGNGSGGKEVRFEGSQVSGGVMHSHTHRPQSSPSKGNGTQHHTHSSHHSHHSQHSYPHASSLESDETASGGDTLVEKKDNGRPFSAVGNRGTSNQRRTTWSTPDPSQSTTATDANNNSHSHNTNNNNNNNNNNSSGNSGNGQKEPGMQVEHADTEIRSSSSSSEECTTEYLYVEDKDIDLLDPMSDEEGVKDGGYHSSGIDDEAEAEAGVPQQSKVAEGRIEIDRKEKEVDPLDSDDLFLFNSEEFEPDPVYSAYFREKMPHRSSSSLRR
jgi:hypothetical protein